jgi:hypothetical protein
MNNRVSDMILTWSYSMFGWNIYLEVGNDLLDKSGSLLLEFGNTVRVGFLKLTLDGLHVTLDIGHVGLLVEGSLGQTEGVDDVVDSLGRRLGSLLTVFSGGVGTDINITFGNGDHLMKIIHRCLD